MKFLLKSILSSTSLLLLLGLEAALATDFGDTVLPLSNDQSFDAETFIDDYQTKCKPYAKDISTCLAGESATNMYAREAAGFLYNDCLGRYSMREWYSCQKHETYEPFLFSHHTDLTTSPLNLTLSKTCSYVDPGPILYSVCGKELMKGLGGSKCCNSNTTTDNCADRERKFRVCTDFATVQYLRCSSRYPQDVKGTNSSGNATAACVDDNFSRWKWPVTDYVLQAGEKCDSPKRVLMLLAISNLIAFLSALLLNTTFIKFVFGKKEKWHELKRQDVKISFLRMFITTGTQVSVPIAVGYILRGQGYTTNIAYQIFIWGLRPRSAFLVGLLGLVHPMWMETALDEMVADLLFSLIGGAWATLSLIGYDKALGTGGPITIYFVGCGMILFSTLCVLVCVFAVLTSCKAFLMFLASIFLAIWELIIKIVNLYRKARGRKDRTEPPSVTKGEMKGIYELMLAGGCLLFVGGWIVWSTMLVLAGDLYCPADLKLVATVLFIYPILLNLVRGVFSL